MNESETDALGRAAHEAWKTWRVAGGYPDHAYRRFLALDGVLDPLCEVCVGRKSAHHEDMVDWDDLAPAKRQKYILMAEAGAQVEREHAKAMCTRPTVCTCACGSATESAERENEKETKVPRSPIKPTAAEILNVTARPVADEGAV